MASQPKTLSGRLTKDRFGASMPVDAPYYQTPPFYYRDARSLSIRFETEAAAAAELLPEHVQVPIEAEAVLSVLYYPVSTFGPYHETILGVPCSFEGAPHLYIAYIVVDTVPPLAGGREIWGYPKKMAKIELTEKDELVSGTMERPAGVRLVTATMRPERPITQPEGMPPVLSLRVIPSPEPNAPPSLADLVSVSVEDHRVHSAWSGPATLSFDTRSELDPWNALPVKRVLGGVFNRYDFTLPHGRIVRQY